ncbi:Crp/Fnr family transcriptional regulator [Rhizorhabdus dicambivorans]|uniref:Cyclic nucleotide-binding protein n=1 Tax=Rhizorhabdus dicambivorans TaxID=1850238 RepID=A0A2A4FWU1_9SPHN|nr:cyclic nucleotide-binding domain-containing protein [Rhizorhabdus dicambivorans]ATE64055.1 cyclic nucleotide-binding protein [Rhizorhabdus dicambivorans]PCE42673.1 cyclic nucleotide-binding protein [Rhizorhabdus dicambivorans]
MQNARYIAAGLSDSDMLWLLSVGKLRRLKAGERLVTAGKSVADLFFVTSGQLGVVLEDGSRVAQLHTGDVVGEMSFVERHSPLVSVIAEEPTEMLAIPRKLILDRFEQEPVFAARFYRALAVFLSERLRETTAAVKAAAEEEQRKLKADKAARARFTRLFVRSGP